MTTSMVTDSNEKLDVGVCNVCYDNNKENFEKYDFMVVSI